MFKKDLELEDVYESLVYHDGTLSDYQFVIEQMSYNDLSEEIFEFIQNEYPDNDVIWDLTVIIFDYLEENYENNFQIIGSTYNQTPEDIETCWNIFTETTGNKNIQYFYDNFENFDFYPNISKEEFIDMIVNEYNFFGENIPQRVLHYLDYEKIWDELKSDYLDCEFGVMRRE